MKNILTQIGTCILLCMVVACAKLGSPPGGDKDVTSPKVMGSKPANYSVNYSQNKVQITFDEFVVLSNPFNEFIISPPLEKKPIPQTRGKSIVVELPASKLDSSTYTLDFGQSIKDNNEGNPLPNYQFVLSKTNYIDSFAVSGKLLDDFTLQPNKDAFLICLYSNLADTCPIKVVPSYLGRTNPKGEFTINHVAPGFYKVFALQDANNNMKYDMSTEKIGFLDNPIIISRDSFPNVHIPVEKIKVDSIRKSDTLLKSKPTYYVERDTASRNDSLRLKLFGYSFNIYSFTPLEPYKQYLVDYSRTSAEKFTLIFNETMESVISPRLLNPVYQGKWFYPEKNATMDTVVYWISDSLLIDNDSIVIEVTNPSTDTTGALVSVTDTLLLKWKKAEETDAKKGKRFGENLLNFEKKDTLAMADTMPKPPPRMQINTTIKMGAQDLNAPIFITTEAPVFDVKPENIKLTRMDDTIEVPAKFTFSKDTTNFRKFRIDIAYEPLTTYHLKLFEGVFRDIYTRTIDTTIITFTTQRDDFYGAVKMKMTHINRPTIVQLLDKDEKNVIRQISINSDQLVEFKYLVPGSYKYKLIYDDNENKKWDTGDYNKKKQPEKVLYFPKLLEVRSNWDVEFEWEIVD